MRGKVAYTDLQRPSPGITPAYAGKSLLKLLHHVGLRDHPRVCGEKAKAFYMKPLEEGSPPRMRGKVPAGLCQIIGFGITPAYAGKSCTELTVKGEVKDHPRVCGEKPSGVMAALACAGITPAYAGKSMSGSSWGFDLQDHPRVCGEKRYSTASPASSPGSPPRMRGKGAQLHIDAVKQRITPAYAGKRADAGAGGPHLGDHPRVCGEKSISADSFSPGTGSPPRMRGKACSALLISRHTGITPAYAGKSRGQSRNCTNTKDHPRVCGEKLENI